eukprot:m.234791 g.234791  ORF g.234791 m.234791 type:complete len:268 (+) comp19326_c0_seq13:278-1081(+)
MSSLDLTVRASTPKEWNQRAPRLDTANSLHRKGSARLSLSGSSLGRCSSGGSVATSVIPPPGAKNSSRHVVSQSPIWRPSTASNIQRSVSTKDGAGNTAKSQTKTKKYKLRKGKTEVDEELFGKSKHMNAEEMHRTFFTGDAEFCPKRRTPKKLVSCSKQKETTTSTRLDLTTPMHVPRSFAGDAGQRFRRTNTLQGGYGPPSRTPHGDNPYKSNLAVYLQHEAHRPTQQPPPPMRHPHIPPPPPAAPPTRTGPRMQNNLWGSFPNT